KQCDAQIMKLSEVDQSVTVLSGNRVLSGITFTPQYKGNLTERIKGMVAERVKTVAPSVQVATVTTNADTVSQIAALKEKQQNGADIKTEFEAIEKTLASGQ
nr:YhcN/YlaJ family sporulation lipoprotein [Clostridia bacterium]